ncbi:MAG: tetratricopeptide repeat protein, partial [Planctomycetes bacterium]|nr:tetratricopeptide repeat protein [Planctomycetota bacterium]
MQEFNANDTVNNRYKVLRKLGAGAMGSVYLCEDSVENNVRVALKVLISDNLDDQDLWAKGEYEALTRLRHPNLAKVYNFGRINGTNDYFIVSEFIKGSDLYSATEYLNYEDLVEIIVQICRSLEYIHSQGYVHFDIKPDNILVTRHRTIGIQEGSKVQYDEVDAHSSEGHPALLSKPKAKVIDFGLAEKITGSFSFAIKGTLNYLAPEILNGQTPDKRADLYSLGVTLYHVANRSLPFYQDFGNFPEEVPAPGATRTDLFEMHMKNHPEYLQHLIMKLLEEKQGGRFQSAKDVIHFINRHSGFKFEVETEETRASYFYSAKLVGRKREMNLLKEIHERTFFPLRSGEGYQLPDLDGIGESDGEEPRTSDLFSRRRESDVVEVVVINGEMGSGKSRLLEEFQHFLRLNDLLVFAGNCYEGNNKAYQPLVQILHEVVYRFGLDSELYRKYKSEIVKLLPELPKKKDDGDSVGLRADKERLYFIQRIAQLLIEAAQTSPYVMVINNLHWVDEASIDLLAHFIDRLVEARRKESLRLLLIVSIRPEEPCGEHLSALLERVRTLQQYKEVNLRSLKHAQVYEFLCSMLNFTDVSDEFVRKLEEKTGGNPLFIVETLKTLQDEGILWHSGDGWVIKATNYDRIEIPQNMEDLLSRRFDKLDQQKREILDVLSVLDKPVVPRFLQRLRRFSDVPILVKLRELEQGGLIAKLFEGGKLRFHIAQTKTREILYAKIAPDQRQRYHGEVGAAFADAYRGKEEEILEELAYHYQHSDQPSKALELAMKAGDRLKAIYANENAYDYYLYVLEQVDGESEHFDLWVEIHEKLGELCTVMGRYELADRSYSVLLADERFESLEPSRVVKMFINRGKVFEIQGDYDSALTCYKDSRNYLSSFHKADLVIERIWVFNSIGWVYVNMGKYEKALAISLEALRVIEDVHERIEHAMVYNTIGSANFYKGNIQEAIRYHRRSLEIKENLENIPETIISLNHLASAFLAGCEYGEAVEHLRRALKTSGEVGDPYGKALTLHNFSRLYFMIGQPGSGWKCLDDSLKLSKDYNMRYLNIQNYVVRGRALHDKGEYSKAEGDFFRALTAFTKQGNRWGLCTVLLDIAELHRLRGNHAEGLSMVSEAKCYAAEMDIPHLIASCYIVEARILRGGSDDDSRAGLHAIENALDLSDKHENPELCGEANFEMGETLVRLRMLREASQYYKVAEAKCREVYDNLPEELRKSYSERQKHRVRDWNGSTVIPKESCAALGK